MSVITNDEMIKKQIIARGIKDSYLIKAFQEVDRALFVPSHLRKYAYQDSALEIGYGQTISQPYIVAFMTQAAKLTPESKVLEIGTGSGYQAAILSKICSKVYTVEVIPELEQQAAELFKKLNYNNIHVQISDGYEGWRDMAPFDVIIATAAPDEVPQTLINQLSESGGKLIIPVGSVAQELLRITRINHHRIITEKLLPVRFVPMVKPKKS